MTCHHSRLLLAFRPDELAGEDRVALDSHLRGCPACAAAARNESAADSAIRTALLAVPVPDLLRTKLHAHVSALQGAAWRLKTTQWAVRVLALCLTIALVGVAGYYATRPTVGPEQFGNPLDRERWNKEQAVSEWLAKEGLPTDLPEPFEYGYHLFHGTGPVGDLTLPCVVFHNGQDTCRVYIVRESAVKTPAGGWTDVTGSQFNIKTHKRGGWVYVIAYTSQTLDPFLKQVSPAV